MNILRTIGTNISSHYTLIISHSLNQIEEENRKLRKIRREKTEGEENGEETCE